MPQLLTVNQCFHAEIAEDAKSLGHNSLQRQRDLRYNAKFHDEVCAYRINFVADIEFNNGHHSQITWKQVKPLCQTDKFYSIFVLNPDPPNPALGVQSRSMLFSVSAT